MQIDEAREFIKFLHGAVPWNGTWFGEYAPGEKGAYWWRKHLDEAIAALIAAPAAPQQAEPVGYFVNDESDDQWHQVDYEQRNGADTYPLYLHPPADEVRRLRDALDEIESETQDVSIQQIARKALEEVMTEWVLVPREPTAKMVLAAFDAITNASGEGMIRARWRCMLDAAPAAPQQAEPVAWMAFGGALVHAVTRNAMDPIEAERFDVPLYLHPPAAPQQAEPALNERVGLAYKNGYEEALNDCIRNGGEAWARSMFANGGEHIKPQQAEPVAWVRNLTDPQPHCVTGLQYRTAADADAGVQYIPVYLHPPAAEVRLQGGLDNEELLEAWRTKVPGVEPTDSDLRAFALGVEFGTRGKRVYFDERNSARDAWRRRVKQCETLEAEVQRLKQERDGLKNRLESRHDGGPDGISARDETIKMQDAEVRRLQEALEPFTAIDLTTNQAVDAMDVLRARRALEGGE